MKTLNIIVVLILCSISVFSQKQVDLKLNLEKGKVYRFKSSSESAVTQTMNGNQQTSENKNESYISIKAVDMKPDFYVIEYKIDSTITSSNTMGRNVVFNSNSAGDINSTEVKDVMNCIMNRMAKNPLYVKIDKSGKASEIINYKMFSESVLNGTDSLKITGMMAPMIKSQIKGMVNEKSLKTTTVSFLNYLPQNAVKIGDTWESVSPISMNGMEFDIKTTSKLESLENGVASLKSDASIQPSSNEPMVMGGYKINYSDLKGLSKSTVLVDAKSGILSSSIGKTQMSGNLSIDIPGNPMQMPMDISVDTKVTYIQ